MMGHFLKSSYALLKKSEKDVRSRQTAKILCKEVGFDGLEQGNLEINKKSG